MLNALFSALVIILGVDVNGAAQTGTHTPRSNTPIVPMHNFKTRLLIFVWSQLSITVTSYRELWNACLPTYSLYEM